MRYRVVDPIVGSIILDERRNVKNLTLVVKESGEIRLTYPYGYGKANALLFAQSKKDEIEKIRSKDKERRKERGEDLEESAAQRAARETLYRVELMGKAKEYLPGRLSEISKLTGLKYRGLYLGDARSRWGSCNSKGRITFSLYLMRLPKHLIDFIIVHELCHTVHMNHSADFHALVNRYVGGREKELDAELKVFIKNNKIF